MSEVYFKVITIAKIIIFFWESIFIFLSVTVLPLDTRSFGWSLLLPRCHVRPRSLSQSWTSRGATDWWWKPRKAFILSVSVRNNSRAHEVLLFCLTHPLWVWVFPLNRIKCNHFIFHRPWIGDFIPFCSTHFACGWVYIVIILVAVLVLSCLMSAICVLCCCKKKQSWVKMFFFPIDKLFFIIMPSFQSIQNPPSHSGWWPAYVWYPLLVRY